MQQKVNAFMSKYHLSCGENIRYMDLVSEVGELGKEIIKSTDYGKRAFNLNETTLEEMGDCLFSILALCCELNIDASEALEYALNKYEERFNHKQSISSGN